MMGLDKSLLEGTTWRWFITAVFAGVTSLALTVAIYSSVGYVIDHLYRDLTLSTTFWIILGGVVALKFPAAWLEKAASYKTSAGTKLSVRDKLYHHTLKLGPGVLDRERTGELANTATEGMEYLETFYGLYWVQFIIGVSTPVLLVGYILFLDWAVGLSLVVSIPLTPAFLMLVQRQFKSVTNRYFAAANRLSDRFLNSLQGISTLKMFNYARKRGEEIRQETESLRQETMKLLAVNQLALFVVDWGFALGTTAVVTTVSVLRIEAGMLTIGTGVTLVLLSVLATRPLNLIGAFFFAGAIGRSVAKKVGEFLEEEPPVKDAVSDEKQEIARPSLTFRDVTFSYNPDESPALKNVSFQVASGEQVALIGPSGAGKTTLVNLLFRFITQQEGEILLDQTPLHRMSLENLRRQITLVSQDPYLFYGTVEENLRVAKADASAREMREAAATANIHDFFSSLPEGYQTLIGERGMRLSGGEAQRLAIARAILKDAPLVVLDEPTSQIDSGNEQAIHEAMEKLLRGRTVLTIAHRLSTVQESDRVLVLHRGKLIESGTHQELLHKDGFYANLLNTGNGSAGGSLT